MPYKIPTNVLQAASVLDTDCPKWYNRVDLDILINMMDFQSCVLYQVYGHWGDSIERLFGWNFIIENGANLDIFASNKYLNQWRILIEKRQLRG